MAKERIVIHGLLKDWTNYPALIKCQAHTYMLLDDSKNKPKVKTKVPMKIIKRQNH